MRNQDRGTERGATAVEMAILLPVFVLLVFGMIDFSRIFNGELQIAQAAREGARLASLAPAYTDAQAVARAQEAAPNVAFTNTPGTAVVTRSCPAAPDSDDTAEVTVSFTFEGILYPAASTTYSQSATMRCGG